MKKSLLLLLLCPMLVNGQNRNIITSGGYCAYSGTIDQIVLLNPFGQTVYSESCHEERVPISIANQSKGMYIIKINGSVVGKYQCAGNIQFTVGPGPGNGVCVGVFPAKK